MFEDAGVADHAYSHCLAVLRDPQAAAEVASVAIRKGGRARWAVLAHARHDALARPATAGSDLGMPAPNEVADLAGMLVATRPPEERALVDLADRHGFDRAALGRMWGTSPADANAELAAVTEVWQRELDPALLAALGPGDCQELATLLTAILPAPTIGSLLDAASAVDSHVAGCDTCGDRVRAMVSVRTVFGSMPIDRAPDDVRAVARSTGRPFTPLPADDESDRHRRLVGAVMVIAGVALIAILGGVITARARSDDRVAQLTNVAVASQLAVQPAASDASGSAVTLENKSRRALRWSARAPESLAVQPGRGHLEPGGTIPVQIGLRDGVGEGDVEATVTFVGDDGSSTGVRVETSVDRPPEIDARIEGCAVTALVQDETELASVTLMHEHTKARRGQPMARNTDEWTASLPPSTTELRWWVEAVDARGNHASTPAERLPAGACTEA